MHVIFSSSSVVSRAFSALCACYACIRCLGIIVTLPLCRARSVAVSPQSVSMGFDGNKFSFRFDLVFLTVIGGRCSLSASNHGPN